MKTWMILAALVTAPLAAQTSSYGEIGQVNEITVSYETADESSSGGRSSSHGRTVYIERVIAFDADGVLLEYDLPLEAGEDRPAINWQYPVLVRKSSNSSLELTNRAELEARRDAWLQLANIPEEVCGEWYFTWNAFQVECDPDDTLALISEFDLTAAELFDGAVMELDGTLGPSALQLVSSEAANTIYLAEFQLDPGQIQEKRARGDVIIAGFSQRELSYEMALAVRRTENVSGRMVLTLDAFINGEVWRRKQVSNVTTTNAFGEREVEQRTVVTQRVAQTRRTSDSPVQ